MKRSPILSSHSLVGPVLRHGFDLTADLRITTLLCERAHAVRLAAAVLRFCFRHWIHPATRATVTASRGAGRELILGDL